MEVWGVLEGTIRGRRLRGAARGISIAARRHFRLENVALFFGLARMVTDSIVGASLAHGLTNVLLFLTMPLGVNHFDLIAYHLCGP